MSAAWLDRPQVTNESPCNDECGVDVGKLCF